MMLSREKLREFAERYTAAWCSQDPTAVSALYSPNGSLTINADSPAAGRQLIAVAALRFMVAFPDLHIVLDDVVIQGDRAVYHWTLSGTNTGPGGSGSHVRISGFEVWTIGNDGLIAESQGHFDTADYQRQLRQGASGIE
jgi:predicted ester cyclase